VREQARATAVVPAIDTLIMLIGATIALQAVLAVPLLSIELAAGVQSGLGTLAALLFGAGILWAAYRFRDCTHDLIRKTIGTLQLTSRQWLFVVSSVGLTLRLTWAIVFPTPPTSDAATYLALAGKLAHGEQYYTGGTYSWWPPGYPFFLVPFFFVFDSIRSIILVSNSLLFVATILTTYALASRFTSESGARLATALLAVWPGFLTCAALACKELVVAFLLPLAALALSTGGEGSDCRRAAPGFVCAGLVLGFASLVQPSLLLLAFALLAYEVLGDASWTVSATRTFLVIAALCLVIVPWSVRNHYVFRQPVLISTNGGHNFYRANNPLATGGYTPRGEQDLNDLGELEASAAGYKWGVGWIRGNPGQFLALALRKQVLFLGDDGYGVYDTLKRGLGVSGGPYTVLKAVCNVFWLGVWALLLRTLSGSIREQSDTAPRTAFLLIPVVYLYVMHSVFESGGRYHVPLIPILAVLLAVATGPTAHSPREVREGCELAQRRMRLGEYP